MTDVLDAPTSPLGKPIKRTEDPRFITGEGNYLDDIKLASMAHMAILRSPYAHANIRSIDTSAAKAMPGVVAVFVGRRHPVQPAADGLAGRRQRGHPEQHQHAAHPGHGQRQVDRRGRRGGRGRDRGAGLRRARGDRGRLRAAARGRRRREGDAARGARSSTRTPRTTSSSSGPSATRPARMPRSTPPRSWSASGSSTSGSSRTRWRPAATSAGTTPAPTSTRSGCRARRRTSSGCC